MDMIIQNAYKTPDGTILFSKNDKLIEYFDTSVEKSYHICGGKNTLINNIDNVCTSYILTGDSTIEDIKQTLLWRTKQQQSWSANEDDKEKTSNYLPLIHLDTEHLKAIRLSKGVDHLYQYIIGLILKERKIVVRF